MICCKNFYIQCKATGDNEEYLLGKNTVGCSGNLWTASGKMFLIQEKKSEQRRDSFVFVDNCEEWMRI